VEVADGWAFICKRTFDQTATGQIACCATSGNSGASVKLRVALGARVKMRDNRIVLRSLKDWFQMMKTEKSNPVFKFSRYLSFVLLAALSVAVLAWTQARAARHVTTQNPAQQKPTPTPAPTPSRPRVAIPTLDDALPPPPTPKPTPTPKPSPTPTPTPEGQEIDPEEIIIIKSNIVNLNVRVIDRNNRPQANLRQEDFRVFEDGVAQPIEFFSREEVPISYGLAIDNSGSLRSQLPQVIEAGKAIVNSNKPGDETFLMRFISSDKIETIRDFTADKKDLVEELDNLYTEGGQTAVIDGIYLGAEHVAEYRKGNKDDRRLRALIVVTDGEDKNSYYKQEELMALLREQDVQIFIIGFVNELDKEAGFIRKSSRQKSVDLLTRIAKETGGRVFLPNSVSELPAIAQEIVRDMRTQYSIGYNPTNKSADGTYRAIRVSVTDGPNQEKRIALTRSGRTAGATNGDNKGGPPRLGGGNPPRKP
jgi:Ca-activated chloride channel family protein